MNYTLHQLQVFIMLAKMGSVSKTARALNLTQPAISMQLRKFQDQFTLPLTETIGRTMYLTQFGEEIRKAAEPLLEQMQVIHHKTLAFQLQHQEKPSLMVTPTAQYVVPRLISDFLKINPAVDFNFEVAQNQYIVEALEKNRIDFAVLSFLPSHLQLEIIPLVNNQLHLVTGRSVYGAQHFEPLVSASNFLLREKSSAMHSLANQWLRSNSLQPKSIWQLNSNEAIKHAVIAGLGCALLPFVGIKKEIQQGELTSITSPELPLSNHLSLVYLKGRKLLPVAHSFLNHVIASISFLNDIWNEPQTEP
jgi:DNA-binding transcriptional LysR family regulator